MLRCRFFAPLVVVCWLLLPLGCGGSNGRQSISGTVKLDGAPLSDGTIRFRPATGNSAGTAGGRVADGQYEISAEHGLVPGQYLVTIEAMRKTGKQIEDPQMGMIDELAPLKFNETGKLTATVSAGSGNVFQFEVTTVP